MTKRQKDSVSCVGKRETPAGDKYDKEPADQAAVKYESALHQLIEIRGLKKPAPINGISGNYKERRIPGKRSTKVQR